MSFLDPPLVVWNYLQSLWPGWANLRKLHRPHFNFITLHYLYLITLTIVGSGVLYGARNIAYIDALFFGSGAATQSGLNTVDINLLKLYQQIWIMIIPSITNPIFINSFLVFVRLYWFEKRFQNVVHEARLKRAHTTLRSRTKSEMKQEQDLERQERGVNGRKIQMMPDSRKGNVEMDDVAPNEKSKLDPQIESSSGSGSTASNSPMQEAEEGSTTAETHFGLPPGLRPVQQTVMPRVITFADQTKPPTRQETNESDRLPQQRSPEQHIAFLERQRNAESKAPLRIPGPRDFDKGDVPQPLDGDVNHGLKLQVTNDPGPEFPVRRRVVDGKPTHELNADDHPPREEVLESHPEHRSNKINVRARVFGAFNSLTAASKDGNGGKANGDTFLSTMRQRARTQTFARFRTARTEDNDSPMPYLSWQPTIGRNSAFYDLDEKQREELGGIEYRALKTLAVVLVCYYVGFHVFGMTCLLPWIMHSSYRQVPLRDGIDPAWWGVFTPASLFNDLGYTLNPDSLISFQAAVFPLLIGSFLIIIGNTGFPCMLRFVIWLASKCVPERSGVWEELRFLLDHPRRCFTLLFPSKATWWLFWILFILNGVDVLFFIILDLNQEAIKALPAGIRVLDGYFQAASTRTAGFAVVNLADLHPAVQVSYMVMMYISVFPVAISIRRTNVYEEKSLGLYGGEDEGGEGKEQSYVGTHLRRQLSFDLWYIFLGLFLISIIEGVRIENTNEPTFTVFTCLFEIISAYGTVGLSLGFPGYNTSFSGQFKTLSKLIIIAMEIRGRHRGLPYALDRAILLPSDHLHKKEAEDAKLRAERRNSNISEMMAGHDTFHASDGQSDPLERKQTGRSGTGNSNDAGRSAGLARILTGALNAGPTLRKEKTGYKYSMA